MGAPIPRLAASVLVALLAGTALAACGDPSKPAPTPSRVVHGSSVHQVNALSGALSSHQRRQVLAVVRDTATTTRPKPANAAQPWSSNVTRVVAAIGSLHDAAAWKKPTTPWQLSNPHEADHPVLVVQMFGRFQFSRLATRQTAGHFPKVVKYIVPEVTYVISTFDGAHLSSVQGGSTPHLAPARTIFAR